MKKLCLLVIAVSTMVTALAQEQDATEVKRSKKEERKLRISAIAKQEEEGVIKYKKHTVIGVKLTTDGYGGFIEVARAQSIKKALLFQLEITERKSLKETKQQLFDDFGGSGSPIIYGKINFFYPVKLGVQQQFLLGNKGNKNGVSISANAGGGITLGLLRPYLLELRDTINNSSEFVKYDPNDTTYRFLNSSNYLSGPGLSDGWSQLKMTPGLYAKTGLRFDFGKYNEMVNALEVGLMGEFYTKKIPQMAFNTEKQFFFSAYIAIQFGKRK